MSVSGTTKLPEGPAPGADYPSLVASWVGETIPELEAGIHNRTLAELIERPDVQEVIGPALVERYRAIARETLKHDPLFRGNWTRRLVEVFQAGLQVPKKLFPAKAAKKNQRPPEWSVDPGKPPSIVASPYQGDVTLRPDQVLSARRWGNWFSFGDELLERVYNGFLVTRSLQFLASNIANLWSIEATFLSGQSHLGVEPAWNSESPGGQFEHLMLDVLNERVLVARPAALAEDILEKTDLRVTYPAVKRRGGSRVQVSLTAGPEQHDRKVNANSLSGEFIFLTPLELAGGLIRPPAIPPFAEFPWKKLRASLGGACDDQYALAQELHRLFVDAISFAGSHPLGPIWILPPPLRQFIRVFTEHRAAETTHCVRDRLKLSRRRIDSVGKYTGPYWKAKFAEAAAKAGPAAPGTTTTQAGKE